MIDGGFWTIVKLWIGFFWEVDWIFRFIIRFSIRFGLGLFFTLIWKKFSALVWRMHPLLHQTHQGKAKPFLESHQLSLVLQLKYKKFIMIMNKRIIWNYLQIWNKTPHTPDSLISWSTLKWVFMNSRHIGYTNVGDRCWRRNLLVAKIMILSSTS